MEKPDPESEQNLSSTRWVKLESGAGDLRLEILESSHWKKTPNHQERGRESEGVARAQYVTLCDSETRGFPCLTWSLLC